MTRPRSVSIVLTVAVLALALAARQISLARAQQPEPQTVQPGTAAIYTDKQQYTVGEPIQVCYTIPFAGNIVITDLPSDGSQRTFYSGPSNGTRNCIPGVITPPTGTECLRLTYPLAGGQGQTQTCFQVVGATPPPPPSGLSIFTDRASYRVGDRIQICYKVPAPGQFTITDILADGTQQTLQSGFDDGTGGCFAGTVTPPAGTECLRIDFVASTGTVPGPIPPPLSAQTCFQVTGPTPPPPPSGWTFIGSGQVDGSGNFNYDGQASIPVSLTYMRVTSGGCSDDPAVVLVWEANFVRATSGRLGVDAYVGDLEPTGLAVSSGGAGHGRLTRPVVANPVTQVDATLFSVGIVYTGTTLSVCLRAP